VTLVVVVDVVVEVVVDLVVVVEVVVVEVVVVDVVVVEEVAVVDVVVVVDTSGCGGHGHVSISGVVGPLTHVSQFDRVPQ